jgi:tetratricopeptide (TPR) repeat protein
MMHKLLAGASKQYALEGSSRLKTALIAIGLLVLTVIAYWPVTGHEFIGYDDPRYVTRNESVKAGFGPGSVEYAFQSDDGGNWHPLTWFSLMLDVELFGLDPAGHHASNVVYHIIATVVLFFVLNSWTGAVWRSAFVAGAFALHPLHVESVAWIAERKDTLSAVFWVLCMAAYGWYAVAPRLDRYLLVMIVFALGLMSKPMLVTLPLVLLLLDVWPLGRLQLVADKASIKTGLWLALEKLPLLALSAVASFIAMEMQGRKGALVSSAVMGFGDRISNALLSYIKYLGKTFWPTDLAVFYPHPDSIPALTIIAAAACLLFVSAAAVLTLRTRPYFAVGWFWYLGTLVPVIGLVQVGAQSMADRYTYIPLIGIFIVIAWACGDLLGRIGRPRLLIAAGVVVLCVWLAGTRLQLRHWQNEESLYRHAIAVTSKNFMMHHNLGVVLQDRGELDEALYHYREATEINGWGPSQQNLGTLLARKGKHDEAIEVYTNALRSQPGNSMIHNNLANSLVEVGEIEKAIEHFRTAIKLRPRNYHAQSNLALNLVRAGRPDEAILAAQAALRTNPRFAQAHNALAIALVNSGRPREAIESYRNALKFIPNWPPAMRRLAWLYATYPDDEVRSGRQAVNLARTASSRTGNRNASMLDTLAAAYAEAGNFDEAIATAERAIGAAESSGQQDLAAEIGARREMYMQNMPYRDLSISQ